jgi:hypothetical protein
LLLITDSPEIFGKDRQVIAVHPAIRIEITFTKTGAVFDTEAFLKNCEIQSIHHVLDTKSKPKYGIGHHAINSGFIIDDQSL